MGGGRAEEREGDPDGFKRIESGEGGYSVCLPRGGPGR